MMSHSSVLSVSVTMRGRSCQGCGTALLTLLLARVGLPVPSSTARTTVSVHGSGTKQHISGGAEGSNQARMSAHVGCFDNR